MRASFLSSIALVLIAIGVGGCGGGSKSPAPALQITPTPASGNSAASAAAGGAAGACASTPPSGVGGCGSATASGTTTTPSPGGAPLPSLPAPPLLPARGSENAQSDGLKLSIPRTSVKAPASITRGGDERFDVFAEFSSSRYAVATSDGSCATAFLVSATYPSAHGIRVHVPSGAPSGCTATITVTIAPNTDNAQGWSVPLYVTAI